MDLHPALSWRLSILNFDPFHPTPIRLITLQKRVVRIMSRSAFHTHTDPLFKIEEF